MLGERLKQLRESKKLTQQEMADTLGIARGTYAHYEISRREPDNATLGRLASFFCVTTDYLLGRTDTPTDITKTHKQEESSPKDTEVERLANELKANPKYLELHRLVKDMPKKEIEEVLDFAKYKHLKGNDRGPDDDDDF